MMMLKAVCGALAAAILALPMAGSQAQTARPAPARGGGAATLTVFAASDLAPAFKHLVPDYERFSRTTVTLVFGSTGALTHQIRNGAPADVFFSADETYVAALTSEGLTVSDTRTLYARGRIATVRLRSSGSRVEQLTDLTRPEIRRIAIANPAHAPYGGAAKRALEAAGLWHVVQPKLVFAENVQQAVQFVRSGSAQAGIVARSVADTPDLVWTLVDQRLYTPLNQVAVVLARTRVQTAARSFISFVSGAEGRQVLHRFGFLAPRESDE